MKKEELVDKYIEKTGYGMDMWGKEENHVMITIAEILDERQNEIPTDEHIKVIAEKLALKYAYKNEYSYDKFVKAIIDGIKIYQNIKL